MRRLGACVAAALLVTSLPAIALAVDPPPNDTFGGAEVIPAIPYVVTSLDTTAATTDENDVEANANCGAPATAASVWYSFTPVDSGDYFVDVTGGDYPAGVIVGTGAPGSFDVWSCGPQWIMFWGEAGTTYFILVFSYDAAVNGGTLNMTVDMVPPPPEIDVTINPTAKLLKDRSVVLSGTATCSEPAWIYFWGELKQRAGRFFVTGWGESGVWCESEVAWELQVWSTDGIFVGGKAEAYVAGYAQGPMASALSYGPAPADTGGGGTDEARATVRIQPGK